MISPPEQDEQVQVRDRIAGGVFTVEIGYTDAFGGQYQRTRADCHLIRPGMEVKVRQIMLYRGTDPDAEPFAASGPADG
jgi:hypothetical protein